MTVEEENRWIEKIFNCNIRVPYLSEDQIELLENGFSVKPNFEIEMSDKSREIIKNEIDKYLSND